MQAWIDAFEESLAHARGSSPHTVKAYLADVRAFSRYLEGADIGEVGLHQIGRAHV